MHTRFVFMVLGALVITSPAFAQNDGAPGLDDHAQELREQMQNMTPEQRKALGDELHAKMKERYDNATPEEQARMREEMKKRIKERYDNASPEEQARMRERMKQWQERHAGDEPGHDGPPPPPPPPPGMGHGEEAGEGQGNNPQPPPPPPGSEMDHTDGSERQ